MTQELDRTLLIARQLDAVRFRLLELAREPAPSDDPKTMVDLFPITEGDLFGVFPMSWLRDRLGLTATEEAVLWLLVAHELCTRSRRAIREINTEQVADATYDTVRRFVYGTSPHILASRELGSDAPLRRLGLVERTDGPADAPMYRQTLRVSHRVLSLIHGDIGLDTEISAFARFDESTHELPELEVAPDAIIALEAAFDATPELVIVRGRLGTGRRSLLSAIARSRGRRLLEVDATGVSTQRELAVRQLRVVGRECALFDAIPLIRNADALGATTELPERLDLLETELRGLVLATTTKPLVRRWRRTPRVVEINPPTGAQRAKLWKRAIPLASDDDADVLATMYPLSPALIEAAGKAAARGSEDGELQPHHIATGIRAVLDHRLAGLATRVTVTQTWEDLILPEDQVIAVVELLARIRKRQRVYEDWGFGAKVGRGLGVSALFSGPPGTGKTMCAGLIAQDLGTEIYQVDVSKLVSKWIGETEKNFASLFDAAEAGHAILLFDEADALLASGPR